MLVVSTIKLWKGNMLTLSFYSQKNVENHQKKETDILGVLSVFPEEQNIMNTFNDHLFMYCLRALCDFSKN